MDEFEDMDDVEMLLEELEEFEHENYTNSDTRYSEKLGKEVEHTIKSAKQRMDEYNEKYKNTKFEKRIYNNVGQVIYMTNDFDKIVKSLCSQLYNKYILNAHEIIKVECTIINDKGEIKFYFNNGIMEKYSGLPLTWGHLYFGNN